MCTIGRAGQIVTLVHASGTRIHASVPSGWFRLVIQLAVAGMSRGSFPRRKTDTLFGGHYTKSIRRDIRQRTQVRGTFESRRESNDLPTDTLRRRPHHADAVIDAHEQCLSIFAAEAQVRGRVRLSEQLPVPEVVDGRELARIGHDGRTDERRKIAAF